VTKPAMKLEVQNPTGFFYRTTFVQLLHYGSCHGVVSRGTADESRIGPALLPVPFSLMAFPADILQSPPVSWLRPLERIVFVKVGGWWKGFLKRGGQCPIKGIHCSAS